MLKNVSNFIAEKAGLFTITVCAGLWALVYYGIMSPVAEEIQRLSGMGMGDLIYSLDFPKRFSAMNEEARRLYTLAAWWAVPYSLLRALTFTLMFSYLEKKWRGASMNGDYILRVIPLALLTFGWLKIGLTHILISPPLRLVFLEEARMYIALLDTIISGQMYWIGIVSVGVLLVIQGLVGTKKVPSTE